MGGGPSRPSSGPLVRRGRATASALPEARHAGDALRRRTRKRHGCPFGITEEEDETWLHLTVLGRAANLPAQGVRPDPYGRDDGHVHLQPGSGECRSGRRQHDVLRPRLLPGREPDHRRPSRRRVHGPHRVRLHHVDHHPAAFGWHLRLRLADPAAVHRAHHEHGGDHRLALLQRHRGVLDRAAGHLAGTDVHGVPDRKRGTGERRRDGYGTLAPVHHRRLHPDPLRHHPVRRHALLPDDPEDRVHGRGGRVAAPHRGADGRLQRGVQSPLSTI